MVNRTRDRFSYFGPGFTERKIGANPPIHTNFLQDAVVNRAYWGRCVDVSGLPHQDHPLTITERDNRGFLPLTGLLDQGGGSYIQYGNYLPDGASVLVFHNSTSIPSVGARATTLMARTNPSREEVSIPNFIHELKDLPGMYKDITAFKTRLASLKDVKNGSRTIGNYHLSIQMGWLPFIRDIRKMLKFQSEADKRVLELKRLYSSRGLKRRLTKLADAHVVTSSTIVADSSLGTNIRVRKDIVTTVSSWGTLRWIPTTIPRDIGNQALGEHARRLVFGTDHIGFDAVQAWNALPWTWMADWFGNFGEWLAAHRNDVPAVLDGGHCNIMTKTTTYEVWTRLDSLEKAIPGASGRRILTTKERAQSSGSLSVTLPLLNGRQWSILGALALQRLPR